MSVLQMKRTTSKAEFVNTANQIYVETINFLTRISSSRRTISAASCGRPTSLRPGPP